jgi:5-methyltetrahydrofolate--homocysteine methyltransferase
MEGGNMAEMKELQEAVIEGNAELAESITRDALNQKVSAQELFTRGVIPAMDIVGQKMKSGEYYIPEVLMSVKAFKATSAILKPLLSKTGTNRLLGKVIIGTVQGDLHDIGKNLVTMIFEGGGFEVIDLGIDVPPEKFVETVKQTKPSIVGMSALLTTTMINMRGVVEALKKAGVRQDVKVIIGGAPVSQRFCDEIGADGTANDAGSAVELAKRLTGISTNRP